MIITTSPAVEGHPATAYLGIVTGDAILGANVFKDLFAGIRDIVGGRSAAYEAAALGANAVIGLDLDYETVGANGSMLMVTASGTAVTIA